MINKMISHPDQSNYMRKQNARIYIPPAIVKKSRKLEHWKTGNILVLLNPSQNNLMVIFLCIFE